MIQQRGQSLIETIVALTVIITGLVGAISMVVFSLRSVGTSQNRLIALHLSWEAIEAAQAIRDSNYLAGNPFNTGLSGGADNTAIAAFDPVAGWSFDFSPNAFADNTTQLYLQGGLYRQSTAPLPGIASAFRRLVIVEQSAPDEIRVVSTVQWTERSEVRQVRAERIFYDWR